MKKVKFLPVLVGADVGTYSIARSFYEEYGIKSLVLARIKTWMVDHTKIIETKIVKNLENDNLIDELIKIGKEKPKIKKILFGCSEYYLYTIIKNKSKLEKYFIVPYINSRQVKSMVYKDKFYEICEKLEIKYPKTIVVDKKNYKTVEIPFLYPIIVKAVDSSMYKHSDFVGKKKVFKIASREEFINTLDNAYASTYNSRFVVQEFIPGDDSNMRVLTCYCDKNSNVVFSALGHPLLEEKAPNAIGNYAAIINDENEELLNSAKKFLKKVKFVGFANFDIKYNEEDNTYNFFEINVRLGRSNFYITGSGFNYTKYLVDEYIYKKDLSKMKEVVANKQVLYTIVPMYVLNKYLKDKELLKKAKKLKRVNPFLYSKDLNLKRLFYIYAALFNHIIKYKKYYRK